MGGGGGRKGGEGRGEVKERRRGEEVEKEVKRELGDEGNGGRGRTREENGTCEVEEEGRRERKSCEKGKG